MSNPTNLPFYRLNRELDLGEEWDPAWTPITKDWFGKDPQYAIEFRLALTPSKLIFEARGAAMPDCDFSLRGGSFVENLWQKDCAELFLAEAGTTRYQEFNLSPTGAWWSAVFESYRKRESTPYVPPKTVRAFSMIDDDFWQSKIILPREAIAIKANFDQSVPANVCFVLGGGTQFLTYARLTAKEPDFHRAEQFLELAAE